MYDEAIKFHKTFGLAFVMICLIVFLVGCSDDVAFQSQEPENGCSVTDVTGGVIINCGDGDFFVEDGTPGQDGADGQDGSDGEDAVVLTKVTAPKNSCTKVADGIWVENIQSGKLFDVYLNDNCADNKGEYCDNVIPSFGKSGSLDPDEHPGSATVCWAGDIQISGVKQSNGDLLIYLLNFN